MIACRRTASNASRCRECGAPVSWARNARGKWVPIELEAFPAAAVPHRERLLILQGVAVNEPDATEPVTVLHFAVCPGRLGADRMQMLFQLWPALATRAERHALIRGAGRRSA